MDKQKADELIVEYLPKIYGFAMKKAFSYGEAEDLSADIVAEVYLSLLNAGEVCNVDGYVWRISQHVYAKFVSSKKRHEGISIDGMDFPDESEQTDADSEEEIARLRREITFLTAKRREIVYAFYYENTPIAQIAEEMGIPEGTVKWHLCKARNELKEGISMERKIGKLGLHPIKAYSFGHSGYTGKNSGPEYYMGDRLNLNIVYSVYHTSRTAEEIAEELGVTPVYLEDRITILEENGFLVPQAGGKYTTYVRFTPETYSQELWDKRTEKQLEVAEMLAKEYVPLVRRAVAELDMEAYIPSGNKELLEAAAIFYGVANNCGVSAKVDLSPYRIKTTAGGVFIAMVEIESKQLDPDYRPSRIYPSYWACGNMTRWSEKYPSVYSWSMDTRYSSREGYWENNLTSDYEYLYEYITGTIDDTPANGEKFKRLRKRGYLDEAGKVQIMVLKGDQKEFFDKIPKLSEELKKTFATYALESAEMEAKNYPSQMRDLAISWGVGGFVSNAVAVMVTDILYESGVFKPMTDAERVTGNLLMFSDTLPKT